MPSVSKQQQKFMGIVRAIQKGDEPASKFSKAAQDAAKDMSKSDVKKFAKTKHKGLPRKVKQELLNRLKKEYAFYHTGTFAKKRDHDDDNNLGKKKKYSGQPDLEENKIDKAELILPRGKKVYLQAEEKDYQRGLIVELTNEGGYKLNYWYGEDAKIYPAEILVDGVMIKKDGKEVHIKFHPKLKKGEPLEEKKKKRRLHPDYSQPDPYFEGKFSKKPEVTPKQLLKIQSDVRKINRKIKVYISKHPVTKGELSIELGAGHNNDAEIDKIYKVLKKHTGTHRTGTMFNENVVKNHDGKAAPYGSGYEKIDEIGIFPIQNYLKGIIPPGRLDVITKQDKEKAIALIKDLVYTLNDFWKSNKIPFRVREPRKSDMNRFKKKTKRN